MVFDFKKNVISQKLTLEVSQLDVMSNHFGVGVAKTSLKVVKPLEDVEYYSDAQQEQFNLFANVPTTSKP
jgi:hypothetical protein